MKIGLFYSAELTQVTDEKETGLAVPPLEFINEMAEQKG